MSARPPPPALPPGARQPRRRTRALAPAPYLGKDSEKRQPPPVPAHSPRSSAPRGRGRGGPGAGGCCCSKSFYSQALARPRHPRPLGGARRRGCPRGSALAGQSPGHPAGSAPGQPAARPGIPSARAGHGQACGSAGTGPGCRGSPTTLAARQRGPPCASRGLPARHPNPQTPQQPHRGSLRGRRAVAALPRPLGHHFSPTVSVGRSQWTEAGDVRDTR